MSKYIIVLLVLSHVSVMSESLADGYDGVSKLRTLFTSPLERQKLNEMRASGAFNNKASNQDAITSIRKPLVVKVDGVLLRENRAPVVWVNGKNTLNSNKIDDGIRVRKTRVSEDAVNVPVKVLNKTFVMKPGQVWSESKPEVVDEYQTKVPNKPADGVE